MTWIDPTGGLASSLDISSDQGRPSTPITLSATLKAGSTPVAGKTVTFTFNGSTFTATTNAAGIASVATTAPGTTGSRPITIAFAGDSAYVAASASATLKVT